MIKNITKDNTYTEGRLAELVGKAGNALLIGFLCLICSLPVVTLGASASAFYYAMMKSVRCQRSYPAREFFRAFKKNLLKGSLFTIAIIVITFLLMAGRGMNLNELTRKGMIMAAVYDVMLMFDIAFAIWIFPVLSRFDISVTKTLKLTMTIAVKFFYYTLALIALTLVAIIMILKMSVGFILVIPAAACYAATYIAEPALRSFIDKPEENSDAWFYDGK